MLSAVALIPSAPVLVPELTGSPTGPVNGELSDLRAGVFAAAATLPPRWIAIGVTDSDVLIKSDSVGTFAGYGVDVVVALSAGAPGPVAELPLCALMAGWVRARVAQTARVEVYGYSAGRDAESAVAHGRSLRTAVDKANEPVGVLVIADGLNTLTPPAPGGYDPDSPSVQAALDDALATGDASALTHLPGAVVGRVAYQVLAGLASANAVTARELYRGAPYGVGYFAGTWTPGANAPHRLPS
ncbi:MAG: hypothetical protein ACSLE6_10185 [Mycobacterium sp.]